MSLLSDFLAGSPRTGSRGFDLRYDHLPLKPMVEIDHDTVLILIAEAHRKGWEHGVRTYAVWENGEQLVGVPRRLLKDVLAEGPIDGC